MSVRSPLRATSRLGPFVLAALLLAPAEASAQGPELFRACYVPNSGLVYRIAVPGAPEACRSDAHVEFSWTQAVAGHEHGNLNGLAEDDHPEYVREGEVSGGDLRGTYPDPTVIGLQGRAVSDAAPGNRQVLLWNEGTGRWIPADVPQGGLTLHFAQVGADARLLGGTAVSASRFMGREGWYEVSFPTSVLQCAGSATPTEFVPDIGSSNDVVIPTLRLNTSFPERVLVRFEEADRGAVDTSFSLQLICS